jgi:cyclase
VNIPIIASGGAGVPSDFAEAINAGAQAVLAASIFHFGEVSVAQVKSALKADSIPVREPIRLVS